MIYHNLPDWHHRAATDWATLFATTEFSWRATAEQVASDQPGDTVCDQRTECMGLYPDHDWKGRNKLYYLVRVQREFGEGWGKLTVPTTVMYNGKGRWNTCPHYPAYYRSDGPRIETMQVSLCKLLLDSDRYVALEPSDITYMGCYPWQDYDPKVHGIHPHFCVDFGADEVRKRLAADPFEDGIYAHVSLCMEAQRCWVHATDNPGLGEKEYPKWVQNKTS